MLKNNSDKPVAPRRIRQDVHLPGQGRKELTHSLPLAAVYFAEQNCATFEIEKSAA